MRKLIILNCMAWSGPIVIPAVILYRQTSVALPRDFGWTEMCMAAATFFLPLYCLIIGWQVLSLLAAVVISRFTPVERKSLYHRCVTALWPLAVVDSLGAIAVLIYPAASLGLNEFLGVAALAMGLGAAVGIARTVSFSMRTIRSYITPLAIAFGMILATVGLGILSWTLWEMRVTL